MITLYHAPRSRSSRIIWLLEELGAEYEIVKVDIKRGDGSGAADPNNPHPHKQVPAIVHDGRLITESGAIVLYLTDLYPQAGLAPLPGDPKRGEYLTWLFYYAGVFEPLVQMHFGGMMTDNAGLQAQHAAMVARIESAVSKNPFILGDDFSAADILYLSAVQFARNLLPEGEVIDAYAARGGARPALARALAKGA